MIFERSLQRELALNVFAIFTILLLIMIALMTIRIVSNAAANQVDPSDIIVLIVLTILSYSAIMLVAAVFISILMVLTRWYREIEMTVWLSSGLSLFSFIKPIVIFISPITILIAFLAIYVWPWAHQQEAEMLQRFRQKNEISLISPGQFRVSQNAEQVFFVEQISKEPQRLHHLFVSKNKPGGIDITVADKGYVQTEKSGERYIILENGRHYEGIPNVDNFQIIEFNQYGLYIDQPHSEIKQTIKGLATNQLFDQSDYNKMGELAWRLSLPILSIVLSLISIPLAYENPRYSRAIHLVLAVIIYMTYTNLLNLMQIKIEQGAISLAAGMVLLHGGGILTAALLFAARSITCRSWIRTMKMKCLLMFSPKT